MNITSYALNNRAFLKFLLAILLVGGIYAFYKMSKMEDPEINVMQAIVVATYPGATPYEIELEVADPIERSIMSLPSVKSVQSKSMDNFCMMTVELETTTQSDQLQQEWDILRRKVNDASADLPQGASKPIVLDDFGDVYGMFFAVTFDGYSTVERIKYMSMIERHLKDIEGVGQISVYGKLSPTIAFAIEQS